MIIRQVLKLSAAAILAAVATGCASAPPSPAAAKLDNMTKVENLPGTPGCFWKSNFQGDWTVINDSTLIVHAPLAKDAYVVKLFEPVNTLGFKEALGFEDKTRSGQICNNGDAYLVVPGWQPPQVPIIAVHSISYADQDMLLEAAGKKPLHAQAAVPPAPAAN